ncbi:hypothetical protein CJ305_09605 [Leeuwenhoekiella nanhaiensis]|uniref:TonB-dependent receptor plug domain-containing protein n=2 Tax=Leeuwenhoekiella nanhaiensis TaxID=1655491 RepID=A0A2G1VS34_9FLAO|nr:hypothetical protein CJ305_09605 [Leeuwenhoekiella nanhaiensis]
MLNNNFNWSRAATFRTLLFLLMVQIVSYGQTKKEVQGVVTSENGMPIPGVNVTVKGKSVGAVTDFDGNYTIEADSGDILVFSYVGFKPTEITVGSESQIDISLQEDTAKLDEVVVVGYGKQQRNTLPGAVSEIKSEQLEQNPTANLSNALVGQTSGIIATQRSGEPGRDGSQIFIRGIGTTGDASPIYVIDGIVRTARDFSQLNANEIESFTVLKDAASAAVFGVRGGNGVILITTKRGKKGVMQINLTTTLGVQERTRDPKFLSAYEYGSLYNEALTNQGDEPLYTEQELELFRNGSDPDNYPNTNWFSVLNKTALIQTYNISANGGSEKIQYATSFGVLDQDGIVPNDNFKRYNFRSNIDADVTNTTRLSFDVSGRDEKITSIGSPEVFRWLTSTRPDMQPIKWSNGGYSNGPAYLTLPENGYRKEGIQAFKGRIELEQKLPVEGLTVRGIAAYDKTLTDVKNWSYIKIPFYTQDGNGGFDESVSGADAPSSLYQSNNDFQSLTLQAHINYERSFGDSDISALALYTQTQEKWRFLSAFRDGYTLAIDEIDFGGTANRNNSGYSGSSGRRGLVGRINWTYKDKYILEGSFRADASEQFAPGKRWGFFPSASAAYVLSKEAFLENSETIEFLKLRASYGVLGNDRIDNQRFLYLQSYNVNGNAVFGNGDVQPAIFEGNLANPDVTWETVKKLNVGVNSILWDGALTVNVDYFFDQRSDILGYRNLTVPDLLGVNLPIENLVEINNRGFELELGHRNFLSDDLSYSLNGNLTFARNKVIFIDEPETENPNIRRTGLPLGTQFGLRALGLFQSQEEIDNAPTHFGDTAPGDIRYADVNGDGLIDDNDRVAIGPSNTPEIIYGIRGGIEYKDFDFSFLFQGAARVRQYYSGEAAWPFFLGTGNAYEKNLDRWTPDNTDASEPRVLIDATNNHRGSSFWLRDASYIRLKNIEIGYNLPVSSENSFIRGMRIYVNANNVATWTKIEDYDPENDNGRGWGYPQLRIWNVGLNMNF